MLVSKVPGGDPPTEHRPVIVLGVLYQLGVLLSIKESLRSHTSIHLGIFEGMPLQIHQLSYDFGFAGMSEAETSTVAIGLVILTEVFEATIAIPGATCSLRVN